jgi:hypothetical protein
MFATIGAPYLAATWPSEPVKCRRAASAAKILAWK